MCILLTLRLLIDVIICYSRFRDRRKLIAFSRLFRPIRNKILTIYAGKIAKDARKNARTNKRPLTKVQKAIKVGELKDDGKVVRISVEVDLDIAPEGRAFEVGSGIHGPKGQKYPITPKKKKALSFYWEKLDEWVVLPKVDHPGVKGIRYLGRAVEKNEDGLLSDLADATVKIAADSLGPKVEIIR